MPYLAVREIWHASTLRTAVQRRKAPMPAVFGAWWAVSVARGMMQYSWWPILIGKWRLTELSRFGGPSLGSVSEFYWGLLIAEVSGIAASVLTVAVIAIITSLQEHLNDVRPEIEELEFAEVT